MVRRNVWDISCRNNNQFTACYLLLLNVREKNPLKGRRGFCVTKHGAVVGVTQTLIYYWVMCTKRILQEKIHVVFNLLQQLKCV